MLRMPNRDDACGLASLSTLARMASPFNCRAACSNCGAIARHGPHHAAQKSTTTGSSLRETKRSKRASSIATGLPSSKAVPHLPQTGSSCVRPASSRFAVLQWGQMTIMRIAGTLQIGSVGANERAVPRCMKVPPVDAGGRQRSAAEDRAQQAEREVAADAGDDERLD